MSHAGPLDTILEDSKSVRGEKFLTKSSRLLDDVVENKEKQRSSTHLRQNSAIMNYDTPPTEPMKHLQSDGYNFNGNKFFGVMVNTYNHQLKQMYISSIVANKAFTGDRFQGFQLKNNLSVPSPMPGSESTYHSEDTKGNPNRRSGQSFGNGDIINGVGFAEFYFLGFTYGIY